MTDIIEPVVPETPAMPAPTPEEVERSYNAAMDSVNLINAGKPEQMTDEDWADTLKRNQDHLQIQLEKPEYYAGYDLTPFWEAVGVK